MVFSPGVATRFDELYASFNHPESAFDPIQVVRRYDRVEDRELIAFISAGLAFGRVQSVVNSIETVCVVLGPRPADFIRRCDPATHSAALLPIVHRWIRGRDIVALLWILKTMVNEAGSLEAYFARGWNAESADVSDALESFSERARAIDLKPAYGKVPKAPGVHFFFSRPSSGGACKRLNLFLRWMVRHDGVDPGGWATPRAGQLVIPLDTHTIRTGKCLRLTKRASPGWKMAAEITAALRTLDPADPVRYDFSLCHLGMMGACGYKTKQRDTQCPLKGVCRPR
ncbi:MAG: TIGR02757 family protein [Acidimicrobiia bacterium]|nr:TIGR02757 family protein [Acidimicrobiia bacterium]